MSLQLPALYPIADAGLPDPLEAQVARLGRAGCSLIQVRAKGAAPGPLLATLRTLLDTAAAEGGWPRLVVNDRADLASRLAVEGLPPWGLHLGQGDLPPTEAVRLPGLQGLHFGTSTHHPLEWAAPDPVCDHAGIGPYRSTATKGDHAAPIGIEGLREGCAALRAMGLAPIAIGGLGPEDAEACFRAGAESLAMVGAVHSAASPADLAWDLQEARWRSRSALDPRRAVVMIGASGAGKSTLGALLAEGLGCPFQDLDAEIEREAGRRISDLFATEGEAAFRHREAATLPGLLTRPSVVALGGGAWESEALRRAVAQAGARVLWLAEPPVACWERVAGDPARPLAGDRRAFLARCRARQSAWSLGEPVSAFGRTAPAVARMLLSALD